MTAPTEMVALSQLLAELPDVPRRTRRQVPSPLLQALGLGEPRQVDPDYAATVAAGHVETDEQWALRVLGEA